MFIIYIFIYFTMKLLIAFAMMIVLSNSHSNKVLNSNNFKNKIVKITSIDNNKANALLSPPKDNESSRFMQIQSKSINNN